MPKRASMGSAGYDLAINRAQLIPKMEKAMLSTGICIQTPPGTYARIASRSSAACKGIIILGGVVDTDYRGEVKIIAYNITNEDIFLQTHECIAQIILERIFTPAVREVSTLQPTDRGNRGFGSTTVYEECSKEEVNPRCAGCPYCDDDIMFSRPPEFYMDPSYIDNREYVEYQPKSKSLNYQTNDYYAYTVERRTAKEVFKQERRKAKEALMQDEALDLPQNEAYARSFEETYRILRTSKPPEHTPTLQEPSSTMDPYGEGSSTSSPDRGDAITDPRQAQFDGIPTPSGPYYLLQQYEELAYCNKNASIVHKEEHDKRSHMADIEWTASKQILSSIKELELICQLKETDFRKRSHYQGKDTYWRKALPAEELEKFLDYRQMELATRNLFTGRSPMAQLDLMACALQRT
ncbi:hypothetical protein ZIOFF_062699 [Zingiber officinale]|uniref:dUTP diphosphatase n=1 Tax=Zingiber officinale TaxID=94328 RepID=A0A8J5F5R1_ZINOF|nr:hypothetical protein ZIOFF_062699 [Zingiber officinale]